MRVPDGRSLAVVLVVLMLAMSGCDHRPRRVPIAGRVLIDGEPLTKGMIQFVPVDTRPSVGTMDDNGNFVMTCYEPEDGVIPGTHPVAIVGSEIISNTKIKWHAPKKYADPATSGITIEVDKARDDLVIEITWDGGKPFIETTGRRTVTETSEDI